jgi:hypothetical protein
MLEQSMINLDKNINATKMQVEAYDRLAAAGVKQEVILEILKDKNNVYAIASAAGTVNIKDKFGDLINQTKVYIDVIETARKQALTFEQTTQEAIDANISALDLQASILQNQFDLDNFELKTKIKLAENAVEGVNKQIQSEQDKIDAINFTLKYDPKIGQNLLDDLQEQISDLQRGMELAFDRPIQELQDRSTILSNDLTLIDKAAESINEKYDKQEEALAKISQLNSDIAAQERSRISLADALSQGDISAAAQMANEMRSTAAEAAARRSGDLLAAGRKSEIENLRSASGMTKEQIQAEQFKIEQQTFALEQQRKTTQQEILGIEDRIYNITELREVKLLDIRNIEQTIDSLRNNQLRNAEKALQGLQAELDKNQEILDAKLLAIEKEKLGWEQIQLSLKAYSDALTRINNGPLKTMKQIVDSIAAALSQINNAKYSSTSAFTPPPTPTAATATAAATAATSAANSAATATDAATKKAEEELAAQIAALAAADAEAEAASAALKKAIEDTKKAIADAAKKGDPASKAFIAAQKAAQKAEEDRLAALEIQRRQNAAKAAGLAARYGTMSNGGMVPKYFATGGKAVGSDTVPAMLTPGEFVMNKGATKVFGPMLAAMNGLKYPSMLGSRGNGSTGRPGGIISSNLVAQSYSNPISTNFVTQSYPQMSSVSVMPMTNMSSANVNTNSTAVYNYSVGINVNGSNSSPNDIARAVMTEIKNLDAQRIRSQRA